MGGRRGRAGVADDARRIIGVERRRVERCALDARGQVQPLAGAERRPGGEAVGLGELVPERSIAPELLGDALQRITGAHHIAAGVRALIIAGDRRHARLIKIGISSLGRRAAPERAVPRARRAQFHRAQIIHLKRAVIPGIAQLLAAEPVINLERIALTIIVVPFAPPHDLPGLVKIEVHIARPTVIDRDPRQHAVGVIGVIAGARRLPALRIAHLALHRAGKIGVARRRRARKLPALLAIIDIGPRLGEIAHRATIVPGDGVGRRIAGCLKIRVIKSLRDKRCFRIMGITTYLYFD